MTSELITFNHLRCRSSSTALGTRTGYWKPTRRGTDETPPRLKPKWEKNELWSLKKRWKKSFLLGNSPLGSFICTFPSWLSVTSSSSQCCWTRMASQMIECYQFKYHFAEFQKMVCYLNGETYSGPISFEVQLNDIWTDNILSFEMPF